MIPKYLQFRSLWFVVLVSVFLTSAIPVIAILFVNQVVFEDSILQKQFDHLLSINEIKSKIIERYFETRRRDIYFYSKNHKVLEAYNDFERAFYLPIKNIEDVDYKKKIVPKYIKLFKEKGEHFARQKVPKTQRACFFQYNYSLKDDRQLVPHSYHKAHFEYIDFFSEMAHRNDFYDIFLIDNQTGDIIFSVEKEVDFATNIYNGPYNKSNLAKAFHMSLATADEEVTISDFENYLPSKSDPAFFFATQIYNESGENVATMVFQQSIDAFNDVMTTRRNWYFEGYGVSGESFILGSDFLFRNDSRLLIENPEAYKEKLNLKDSNDEISAILTKKVTTVTAKKAINGESGFGIIKGYLGENRLSVYKPLAITDLNWVILTEMDETEALAIVTSQRKVALVGGSLALLLIVLVSIWIANIIVKPIKGFSNNLINNENEKMNKPFEINGWFKEINIMSKTFNEYILRLEKQKITYENETKQAERKQQELDEVLGYIKSQMPDEDVKSE